VGRASDYHVVVYEDSRRFWGSQLDEQNMIASEKSPLFCSNYAFPDLLVGARLDASDSPLPK